MFLAVYTDITGAPVINQRLSSKRVSLLKKDIIILGYNEKDIFIAFRKVGNSNLYGFCIARNLTNRSEFESAFIT